LRECVDVKSKVDGQEQRQIKAKRETVKSVYYIDTGAFSTL
jgi:hypothetical protein